MSFLPAQNLVANFCKASSTSCIEYISDNCGKTWRNLSMYTRAFCRSLTSYWLPNFVYLLSISSWSIICCSTVCLRWGLWEFLLLVPGSSSKSKRDDGSWFSPVLFNSELLRSESVLFSGDSERNYTRRIRKIQLNCQYNEKQKILHCCNSSKV